mgnify:CR=1 FL=1
MFRKTNGRPEPKRPNSIDVSIPRPTVLHGVTIKEQTTGAYLETIRKMGTILYDIFDAVFPKQTPGQVFTELMTITSDGFRDMLLRIVAVAPDKAIEVLASIMGTTADHLRGLPPYKLAQVCSAFWKVNNLSDFFQMARGALSPALRAMTPKATNTGSSA